LQRGASIEEMAIDLVKNKSLHQINMDENFFTFIKSIPMGGMYYSA
jgi:hypothetical protein